MTQDRYIPGVPCWVDTNQPDPEAAVTFYRGVFGWELEDQMPPESGAHYFAARIDGRDAAAISSMPESAPPMATWNTYVWVDSADASAEQVRAAGGTVLTRPFDVVNEPGAVNFNGLLTRDAQRAKEFYSAVFGWRTLEMDGGFTAWTLPGYGDFLETINPGTRARNAGLGAPAGFEDVVATLSPLGDDRPDVPPRWEVTFAVDDADSAVERATALGGTILAGPFDAPWVRMAVIADPQGATFIASQFVPEPAGGTS